ncbi:MAG: hypothetical protein ACI39W_06315 [Brotaphodocola sp.]
MADHEIRYRANIGTSSFILIFIVLCLATFSVLSLGNARREDLFSKKSAESVQEYYRADAEGEAFVQKMDLILQDVLILPDVSARKTQAASAAGQFYDEKNDCFSKDIEMKSGLALHIELIPDWEQGTLQVQEWKIYDRGVFEIDQSLPVWNGM